MRTEEEVIGPRQENNDSSSNKNHRVVERETELEVLALMCK